MGIGRIKNRYHMNNDISFNRIPADVIERWKTVRDVVSGDQALRIGNYIPQLNPHDKSIGNEERNKSYVARAVFYNATGRTMDGLIGLAFKKDPTGEMPEALDYLLHDADGRKNSIYQQSQSTLANVLAVGRHGMYVDYDNERPVIKSYSAESIINWRFDGSNLSLLVLQETVEESEGYRVEYVTQWRELAIENGQCVCRIWQLDDETNRPVQITVVDANGREVDQVVIRSKTKILDFIPFTFVGSRNNDADIDGSPLYDLARLNVAHFRNSADYEESVFSVGQPQPWASGVDNDNERTEICIGSRVLLKLPTGGSFGFAQPSPNTLVSAAMDQKEKQMISLGARLIDQTAIAVTATQNDNDKEASTSVLSMCVSNVNEAYQSAIEWCALMNDTPITPDESASTYKIRQDYSRIKIDAQAVSALVTAWQSGAIALPDLREYLRSEGIIATERSDDEIDGDLEAQGPALGDMGTDKKVEDVNKTTQTQQAKA